MTKGASRFSGGVWCTVAMLLVALLAPSTAIAAGEAFNFYGDKARGWFWREIKPDPPEEQAASASDSPQAPTPGGPPPLSTDWLRENLPRYRNRAIDAPTNDNLAAYAYLQLLSLDKATNFNTAWQRLLLREPLLDPNRTRPGSAFGSQVFDQAAADGTRRAAAKLAGTVGIWFVFRSDCTFCHAQAPVLEALIRTWGFRVLPVSLDGKPLPDGSFARFVPAAGKAEQLGVTVTPTLFVHRPPEAPLRLGEGLLTVDEILRRIFLLAGERGWLDASELAAARPSRPVPQVSGVGADLAPGELDDPKRLADYLRRRLQAR